MPFTPTYGDPATGAGFKDGPGGATPITKDSLNNLVTGVINANSLVFDVPAPVNVAATDKANINAAIVLANVAGGHVVLRAGTYLIDAALTALANGVTIRGCGPAATVIRSSSTTADMITSTGTSLIGVRDLQLESLVTRTAGSGINFTTITGYIIDNVRFVDTFNLGTFTTANTGWISRIKVAHGAGVINQGFWFQSCVDTHVSSVLTNGGTVALPAGQAWIQVDSGCDTFGIVDVTAVASSGSGTGLYLSHSLSPSSFAPRWIKVSNAWFEGSHGGVSGANGIQIDDCLSAHFENIYTATSLNGINIIGGRDIRFARLISLNNWLRGMVLSGGTGPVDVTVTDSTFDSNSQGLTNNVSHLNIGGSAAGIRIRDTYFGQSVLGRTAKPSYAIDSSVVQASDVQVTGCRFNAADYGTGILGGSGATLMKLRDNNGYNPVGALGPPTVPATTVAYTNAYGVDASVFVTGGTVTVVAIGGTATGLVAGAFRVPAGGTITLTYTVAPTWKWIGD